MKRVESGSRSILPAVVLAVLSTMAVAPPLAAIDIFYLDLLRDGTHAFDRADYPTAARHFRVACFGMLDEPKMLGECLARLALAQDKAGDMDGFRDTFGRLVEVEERFQGYSQSALPADVRANLERRMAALIPAPTLAASPQALRGTPGRGPEAQAAKPRSDKPQPIERSTLPAPAQAAPQATPPPAQSPPPAVRPETETAAAAPAAAPVAAPGPWTEAERKKQEKARKLLAESGKVRELREAFETAREIADAHPESRETQLLAGEAAYRVSRWKEAAEYLGRAGGPEDDQPELLFYLAVALFESGEAPAAAAPLRRALPNLQRTPYVDGYARKILGQ
jgi:tetratricopeptide (TPR) repeat protein